MSSRSKTTRRTQVTTTSTEVSGQGLVSASAASTPAPSLNAIGEVAPASVPAAGGSSQTSSRKEKSSRSGSPLSPTRVSRMQEKVELQHLNDRLATYIDRVRHLENENSRLAVQVQTSQETITREVTSIKHMYEQELSDARKLLDDTAKEKAKMQIEAGKWKSEAEEYQAKFTKRDKDFYSIEKRLVSLESVNNDLSAKTNQAIADRKRFEEELKEVVAEREKLAKQLQVAKAQLEDETLRRVDLENRLQSMKEELAFKENIHEKQLSETKTIKQTEISEIDSRLKDQYEQKFADTLRELRDQYEHQMKVNRDEIEFLYDTKLNDMQDLVERHSSAANNAMEELRQFRSKADGFTSKLAELESQNSALMSRVKDLERMLEQEREWHSTALNEREEELRKLRERMDEQLVEYHNLLDIKVALDLEISAYRKLLEGEESRLNITPANITPSPMDLMKRKGTPVRRTPVRGLKRKRTMVVESEKKSSSDRQVLASAKGDIEISDHCHDGKFVTLFNKGAQDITLGGWQIIRQVKDQEVTFKFHRNSIIKPETSVQVWSSDSNAVHNPPSDVVMKSQAWPVGDSMVTKLLNPDGEEVAIRESSMKLLSTLSERSRDTGYYGSGDELYLEENPANPQERCSIM